ncbi:uncharacterized protein si:ch211-269k10.4 [Periophthalmus magnuspinnatus]|uniref:uncharacterized protein si:ch211-269k10.4 n=1 Tax=Periophthalmus magnuspinnatus TaxID=409849 RepID=UPI00145AF2AD|nr:uncharacterized protein si:ch211-269k10.4 [Periophthalmus magnuspinnatus]XP_055083603.1 uncharacterized protein si:ch211-269k10.4 [Periophthalmus magnuspinnatus]
MAHADVDLSIDTMEELPLRSGVRKRETEITKQYQATDLLPNTKPPLHDLLQKQPAVFGSLQVVSGILSVGVGILFAVTQHIGSSFCSLFRVSQLTGTLFIIAGLVSNMLFKYPELLLISLMVNCGCLLVAVVAASLIIVDLSFSKLADEEYFKAQDYNNYTQNQLKDLSLKYICIFPDGGI